MHWIVYDKIASIIHSKERQEFVQIKRLTSSELEKMKKEQLEMLKELSVDINKLSNWKGEFEEILKSNANEIDIAMWSVQNNIEKELKHISLQ